MQIWIFAQSNLEVHFSSSWKITSSYKKTLANFKMILELMKWNLFWRLRFDFFVEHFWYLTFAHYFSHLETIRLSIQPNYFWVNWKKIFSPIQSILMQITEKTLFTNLFTDKQTVKVFRMKMLTSKRARFELFMIEYCAMVKIEKTFWIVMFHIYYCINYISYYLYEEKSPLHDKLAEKG